MRDTLACFQISQASAEERLEFLLSAGVKSKDMKRILVRQPQILEYTLSNLKSCCFSGEHWYSKFTHRANYFRCSFVLFIQCGAVSEANYKVSDSGGRY